ncbi:MAG: hypothetical protein ABI601_18630 [bacterium]
MMSDGERDLDLARKSWSTARALFCLRGFTLDRIVGGRGFRVTKGQWIVDLDSMSDVLVFAERVGIELPREAPP